MKCENCRFAPVSDAEGFVDECGYFEQYGTTWKDGKEGCTLHWKTLQKNEDEYSDYLGKMGEEMGKLWNARNEGFKEGAEYMRDKIEDIISDIERCCSEHTENEQGEWVSMTVNYDKWADVFIRLRQLKGAEE